MAIGCPLSKTKRKCRIETEKKILDAGVSVFSKYGYDAASLKQIAKEAEVNEALIIRYYGSKADLLTSIIVEYFKIQTQSSAEIPEYETLEEEIREFMLREMRSDFEHREFVRVCLARAGVDAKLRQEMSKICSPVGENPDLVRRFKKLQDDGKIPASTDLLCLSSIVQMESSGFAMIVCLYPKLDQAKLEARAIAFAALITRGVLAES